MRPWIRRLLLLAAMLAGLAAISSLTLFFLHRSGFIQGFVNQMLANTFAEIPPFQAFVEDAWIDLWGPSVEVKNLQIVHGKSSVPIARLDRASLDLWLNPFRGPLLRPKRITVDAGSIDLPHSALQNLQFQGSGSGKSTSLPEIWIRRVDAQFEPSPGHRLAVGELSLGFQPSSEGGGMLRGRIVLPVGPELLFSGRLDENGSGNFVAAGDLHFEPHNTPETEGPQSVWAELRPLGDLSLRVQGAFGASGLRVQADGVAKDLVTSIPGTPFRLQKIQGSFSLGNLKESRCDLQGIWEDTPTYLNGKASWSPGGAIGFDLFAAAQNLPLDERIRRYATLDHSVADIWTALEPKGRCDVSLRLTKQPGGEDIVAEPFVRLRGIQAAFHGFPERGGGRVVGFPLPIEDLRGEILCQPGKVALHQLRGKMRDADLAVSGTLFEGETKHGGNLGIDLQIDLAPLALDAASREAVEHLPPEIGTIWDQLHLAGATELNLRLTKDPGPQALRLSGRIAPRAASARLREFPLPVEGLEGEILLDPERLVGRLRGKAGTGAVDIEIALLELRETVSPALPPLIARVSAHRVPIDEKLAQAATVLIPGITEALHPRGGLLDAEISLARRPAAAGSADISFHREARLRFEQASLEPVWLPLPVDSAVGSILYETAGNESGKLSVQGVEARALGAPVFFHYHAALARGEPPPASEVWLRAADLPLVPDLFHAMEKANLPGASIWGKPQWSGTVTIAWDQKKNRDLAASARLSAAFQDAGLRIPEQSFEMQEITGKLEAGDRGFFSDHFSGKLGSTGIDLRNLRCPFPAESPEIHFLLSVPRLDLAQDLEKALPPSIASRAKAFGLRGTATAEEVAVKISLPPGASPSVAVQGPLQFRGLATQGGLSVENADATLWVQEGTLEGEKFRLRGVLRDGSANLFRRRLENLQTRFEVDDHSLRLFDANGEAYQGKISQGSGPDFLRIDLLPPYAFQVDWRLGELKMRQLLRDLLPRARDLQGILGIDLKLGGEFADLRTLQGEGEIRIRDGALWEVPVFRDVFKVLTLQNPPVFSQGHLGFRVADRKISLASQEEGKNPFDLDSTVMTVTAKKGSLDFAGSLDLDLKIASFSGIPIIGRLIGAIINLVADFHITGSIANPIVNASASGEARDKQIYYPEVTPENRPLRF